MINVIVKRGAGDRPAPDVSDNLITNLEVARATGAAILDREGYNRTMVSGSGPDSGHMEPGKMIEHMDAERGPVIAQLVSQRRVWTRQGDQYTATSDITMRRLTDSEG